MNKTDKYISNTPKKNNIHVPIIYVEGFIHYEQ